MNRVSTILLTIIVFAFCLAGCAGVRRQDVVGTYKLVYQPDPRTTLGTEVLVLKADGTFDQSFNPTHGKGWRNRGRWDLDERVGTIYFTHRLMPIDSTDHVANPPKVEGGICHIWVSDSTVKIEINADIPYRYVKTKQ